MPQPDSSDKSLAPERASVGITVQDRRKQNRSTAARLTKAGLAVFPSKGKAPIIQRWTLVDSEIPKADQQAAIQGFRERYGRDPLYVGCTRRPHVIAHLISRAPDSVVSVSCGPSGLAVLDADSKHGIDGPTLLRAWLDENGVDLSACPMTTSQSGALHIYFTNPTGVGNRRFKDLDTDLKAVGGQVIAPGSIRSDERSYTAVEGQPDLATAFIAGTIPRLPQCVIDKAGERSSELELSDSDERVQRAMGALADHRVLDVITTLDGFDIDGLKARDAEFSRLVDDPSPDHSEARWGACRKLYSAFSHQGWTVHDYAAFLGEWEGAGVHVDTSQLDPGEYNDRSIAREFVKNEATAPTTNSEGLGPVDDDQAITAGDSYEVVPGSRFGNPIVFTGMRLADTRDVEFLAYPTFPLGVVGGVIGHGGSYKSGRTLVEALGVVTGRHDLVGLDRASDLKRASVWVHNGEDEHERMVQRLAAAQQHFRIADALLNGREGHRIHLTSSADKRLNLVTRQPTTGRAIGSATAIEDAIEFIMAHKIKLVVFDPVVELHGVIENSNEDMAVVYGVFRQIAVKGRCHVLTVVHASKPDKTNGDGVTGNMHAVRGASAQTGSMRFIRTMTTMSERDAREYGIPDDQRQRYACMVDAKANHSPKRTVPQWFESVGISPGEGRRSVLVSSPVMLVKGIKPVTNAKAEQIAELLRHEPFGTDKPHVLLDVIAASGFGAQWGDKAGWTVYFRRAVLGSPKALQTDVTGGRLVLVTKAGRPAEIRLIADADDGYEGAEGDE